MVHFITSSKKRLEEVGCFILKKSLEEVRRGLVTSSSLPICSQKRQKRTAATCTAAIKMVEMVTRFCTCSVAVLVTFL